MAMLLIPLFILHLLLELPLLLVPIVGNLNLGEHVAALHFDLNLFKLRGVVALPIRLDLLVLLRAFHLFTLFSTPFIYLCAIVSSIFLDWLTKLVDQNYKEIYKLQIFS